MSNLKLMQRTVFKWSNWLDELLKRKLDLPSPFILRPKLQPELQPELLQELYYSQTAAALGSKEIDGWSRDLTSIDQANKYTVKSLSNEEKAWLEYIK